MNATAAVTAAPTTGDRNSRFAADSTAWPLLALGLILVMQFTLMFTRAINWDEFWFYYHIAEFSRGTLEQPLQTIHVRLFAWLPGMAGNTVDKIVIGRMAMLACEVVTLGAIYLMARRFVDKAPALLAPLLYVSAGFVFQHGFSFRTDPMATACLMVSLAILLRSRLDVKALAAFALLVALAGMITIKIALYAPAFIGIAWLRWSETGYSKGSALRLVLAAAGTVAAFAAIYSWHAQGLSAPANGAGMASSASQSMFFLGIPPFWHIALKGVAFSISLSIMIAITPALIRRSDAPLAEKLALAGLWLPVLTPLFYLNTLAYFYAFILAPVAVACAPAISSVLQRYSVKVLSLVVLVITSGIFLVEDRAVIDRQKQVVEAGERILPQGAAYFDFNGMLVHFTKANDFLSSWGLVQYAQRGANDYRNTMTQRPVPVLLANVEVLEDVMAGRPTLFSDADVAALRGSYIHHWGPFFVAGKQVNAPQQVEEEFLVPGTYRIEDGLLSVDGQSYTAGETLEISRGWHTLQGTATLRWGDARLMPDRSWDGGPLYVKF